MINKRHFINEKVTKKAGMVLSAVLLVALTEGVDSVKAQGVKVIVPAPVVVVAPPVIVAPPVVVAPVVTVQDDYVYYPNYGVYYNSGRHEYAYLQDGAWISAPAPVGVSVEVPPGFAVGAHGLA